MTVLRVGARSEVVRCCHSARIAPAALPYGSVWLCDDCSHRYIRKYWHDGDGRPHAQWKRRMLPWPRRRHVIDPVVP